MKTPYSKAKRRRIYHKRKKWGICVNHNRPISKASSTYCDECLIYQREVSHKRGYKTRSLNFPSYNLNKDMKEKAEKIFNELLKDLTKKQRVEFLNELGELFCLNCGVELKNGRQCFCSPSYDE